MATDGDRPISFGREFGAITKKAFSGVATASISEGRAN